MNDDRTPEQLRGEARYSERLCQRMARLYRRAQTFGAFLAIVGGSGTLSALASSVPAYVSIFSAVLFTLAGAALLVVRPGDKAAQSEADMRRYAALLAKAPTMTRDEFALALEEARPADAPEVEALRNVTYNDVAREFNRDDVLIPLTRTERLIAALA